MAKPQPNEVPHVHRKPRHLPRRAPDETRPACADAPPCEAGSHRATGRGVERSPHRTERPPHRPGRRQPGLYRRSRSGDLVMTTPDDKKPTIHTHDTIPEMAAANVPPVI